MSKYGKPRSTKGLATLCAKLADDKLADEIILINLGSIEHAPADFFVICSCDSDIQVEAVVSNIDRTFKTMELIRPKVEGLESKNWVILDFFDVVVHVFLKEARNYYKLEKLWGDGEFFELNNSRELRKVNNKDLINVIKDKVLN
ncbi:MAG: ribosome silencing factor [Candidatus Kapabacteria bacterium]|nr:ribosome silencing factor [Ignavibacteriota bacterium]MCW5885234.1 ribosome silencing factor [Candidatus Kapabacteria bacterium]